MRPGRTSRPEAGRCSFQLVRGVAAGQIPAGLHAKVTQTRLGHKSITETMDTYGRLSRHQNHETTNALDHAYRRHPEHGREATVSE